METECDRSDIDADGQVADCRAYAEFQVMRFASFCLAMVVMFRYLFSIVDMATYTVLAFGAGLAVIFHLSLTVSQLETLGQECERKDSPETPNALESDF